MKDLLTAGKIKVILGLLFLCILAMPFTSATANVVINEIMYHPVSDLDEDDFLELYNTGTGTVNLEGWRINGLSFTFGAGASIGPNAYLVLARDATHFQAVYGLTADYIYGGSLQNSGETLQLIDATDTVADEIAYGDLPPWPVTPDGLGPSLERIDPTLDSDTPRNWRASIAAAEHTAKAINSVKAVGLPPWITNVQHSTVHVGTSITVTASVIDAATVNLEYIINFNTPVIISMLDNGLSGDGAAGDGVYGAAIPAQTVNTLVRYRINAAGATGSMLFPRVDDTVTYTGTCVEQDASVITGMPIFHWFMDPIDYANALAHFTTYDTEPALIYYDGVLYDGVQIRVRGNSSRQWPKKNWKFYFPQGHDFYAPELINRPVDQFDMQASFADKSYMREYLSYDMFEDFGSPACQRFHVRLYHNGQFFGLFLYTEHPDDDYMERQNLDIETGALYETISGGQADCRYFTLANLPSIYEKHRPLDNDFNDLHNLLYGINNLTGQARRNFIFDNIDIPRMLNYWAVVVAIHDNDPVAKNYYLYRDTAGNQRWYMLAWDKDLTWGRNWQGTLLNDDIWANVDSISGRANVSPSHPLFGNQTHEKYDYLWNRLVDAVLAETDIRQMYLRRLRTVMDEGFQTPGTPYAQRKIEKEIDELTNFLDTEAAMDLSKWNSWGQYQTIAQAAQIMKDSYLTVRRTHLFQTHCVDVNVNGEIPSVQTSEPPIIINEIMYNPLGGENNEFLELFNPSSTESVDLSDWRLDGAALTFPPGTVIMPRSYLVVAKNDAQFRTTYGSGKFVAAQYKGNLDNVGEKLTLMDKFGNIIDEVIFDDELPWPTTPDGNGYSLELIDPSKNNNHRLNWAASISTGGTPGAVNSRAGTLPFIPDLRINEVLTINSSINTDEMGEHEPWIEIYNASPDSVNLGGMFLTNDYNNPTKWAIPSGTILNGGQWMIFWADAETGDGPLHTNFSLSTAGGVAALYASGGGLVDSLSYGALTANISYGRYFDGSDLLREFVTPTPAAENYIVLSPLILNEYSAVADNKYLKDDASDTFWGRILGNGGDWFELVVTEDHLDVRGWKFVISDDTGGAGQTIQTLTLTNNNLWSDLRIGTIITVSENLPDNITNYDPEEGYWWINVQARNGTSGTYITPASFKVTNSNWQLTIKDSSSNVVFGPAGEGIKPVSAIADNEIFKLEEAPGSFITERANYNDGTSSTFGAPNIYAAGTIVQDFNELRNIPDGGAPLPDPLVWALAPIVTDLTSVTMIATTATDPTGDVEYYFNNITNPAHDSGWYSRTYYKDKNLLPNTVYSYRVKARDKSASQNETAWSETASARTPILLSPPVSGTVTTNVSSSSRSSVNISGHVVPAGDNRLLVVSVMIRGDESVTSITYSGINLTKAINTVVPSGVTPSTTNRIEHWYLVAPPVGTASVIVNFATVVDPSAITIINFTGVNQSSPIGGISGATATSGTGMTTSITTREPNSLIFGAASAYGGDTNPFTPGSGITELFDNETGTSTTTDNGNWGGQRTAATAGVYTFNATAAVSDDWAIAAMEIKAAVTYIISGNAGTSGAIMTGLPGNPVTDGSGNYSVGINPGWSGTVMPTKADYTFIPFNRVYTNIANSQINQNHTASNIPDVTPPTPNPLGWASIPTGASLTSITMTAATAIDSSGVEYYFDCLTAGGHDSVWQDSPTYTDTGLTQGTPYTYRTKSRDKSPNHNETGWSQEISACAHLPSVGNITLLGSWVNNTPDMNHPKEPGQKRLLIFIAQAEDTEAVVLDSVTYGGQAMTKVLDYSYYGAAGYVYSGAFMLKEADIEAASGGKFTVTWGTGTASQEKGFASVFLSNVDQTNTIGATAINGSTTDPISTPISLSTNAGDMVIMAATCGQAGTYTLLNGFTEGTDQAMASSTGVTGHKAATGASETPSADYSATVNRQMIIGFVVKVRPVILPGQATNPNPASAATSVDLNADLIWSAGSGATTHLVYFGTSSPGTYRGEFSGATYDPGTMLPNTIYYWRINEKNQDGNTTGSIWSFTTTTPTYTISGNAGTGTVTMNGLPGNPVSDSNGNYTGTVNYGFSGTVTPSKTGFTFSPVNRVYTNVTSNQTAQNYTATQITFTITGNAGTGTVTMNGLPGNPVSDSNGNYTGTVNYGFSGTVTPSKTGFTFSPVNRVYTNVTSNQTAQNYTATQITFTITGNAGTGTVTMNGLPGNPVSDSNGNYTGTVNYGFSGTVTPAKTGFTFSPVNRVYTNVTSNQTAQDYTATINTYTISGNTTVADVNLVGLGVVSDGSGNYTKTVNYGFSATVTPAKAGYTFSPVNRVYTNVTSNQTAQNYTATINTYTISGNTTVADVNLVGLGVVSDGSGNYTKTVNYGFSATVTPAKAGYTFSPVSRTYTNVTSNQTAQDYTATINTYTISGNTTVADVNLVGLGVVSDGSGNYTKTVNYGFSATVTPAKAGYTFSPVNRVYTNVTSNQTAQNYTATINTYTISGNTTVADVNLVGLGVVSDGSGNYTKTVNYGFSATVTPAKAGYTFSPVNRVYTNVTSNQTAQNYTATINTYTISGNTTVADVNLVGLGVVSDGSGNYTKTVNYGFSATVTPAKAGYTFSPVSRTYTNVTSNQTAQDYTATQITFTITGNAGTGTVTMNGLPGNPVSDSNGNYTGTVNYGFSATVTPAKAGYTFSPVSRTYTNVTSNQTAQDYTATINTYTISGNTTVADVNLVGLGVVSDGSGNYTKTVNYGFSATVTPAKAGYTFSPVSRTYTNVTSNQTAQDYTATINTYTISGNTTVADVNLVGLGVVSDGSGNYTKTVNYGFSATVTPAKAGYTFSPVNRVYTNVTSNQTAQNYTATINTYTISGNTTVADVNLVGLGVVSDGSGNYTKTVNYGFSATVTPAKAGYTFSPVSRTYTNVTSNQTAQDYTATQITFTITGNAGTGTVTMNGLPGNPVSDSNGNYTGTVNYGFSGTVTPAKTGFTFSPVNRVYTNVTSNQTAQDYTATINTYTISGNTTVADVNLVGLGVVSDGSGNYTKTVNYGFSATVTPAKAGYTFSPVSRVYTNVTSNQTAQDYTATQITFTITGNAGTGTVTMNGLPGNPVSDSNGNYTGTVNYGFSGTVTPAKTGFTFSPVNRVYTNVTSNQTAQDYTATINTYTISGNTTVADVNLVGLGVVSDGSGNYTKTVNYGFSATVTPAKTGYTFSPSEQVYSSVTSGQLSQDYTATLLTYTISGNAGTSGVTMNGLPGNPVSDSNGNYTGIVNYGFSGTVTPSKASYAFSPVSWTYTSITSDQTNQNYTATLLTYTISGNIGTNGVTMNGLPGNPVSDSSGNYTGIVNSGWSGTVTPSKAGYTFSPVSSTYTNVTSNQTDQNYTAALLTYTISGNAGTSGVVMNGLPGNPVSDSNGNYTGTVNYGFSHTVTPSKASYAFSPVSRTYTNVTSNQTGQDYTSNFLPLMISGYIKNSCNTPIAGVLVEANNGGEKVVTDADGFYMVHVVDNWSGTVTPTKKSYTFEPNQISFVNVLGNYSDQNYIASSIYDLDCDGYIAWGDMVIIADNWLSAGPQGDFNSNGIVNFVDFAEFGLAW